MRSPGRRTGPQLCRVAVVGRRFGACGAVAGLALALASPASALPAAGLLLEGEPEELGVGGSPFHDLDLEALRIERPALLAERDRATAQLLLDAETTLALRAGVWAGTRAHDRFVAVRAHVPLAEPLPGVRLGAFLALEREDAHAVLRRGGTRVFDLEKDRTSPLIGLTTGLPFGLRLAAGAAGIDRWHLEGAWSPWRPLSLWVVRRDRGHRETATISRGLSDRTHAPHLHLPLDFQRAATELGAAFRLRAAWAQGAFLPGDLPGFWLEVGARPLDDLTLRAGADREGHRLTDRLAASGTGEIAAVDLRLERIRGFAEAVWALGPRDDLRLHATLGRYRASTWADEVGTHAARAFLHVDTDLGLLLEGGAGIQVLQLGLGWRRENASGPRFAVGAQYLRAHTLPSAVALVSFVLDRALAEESVEKVTAHLIGLTGFLEVPVGEIRLAAGLGQLLPVAMERERGPGEAPAAPGDRREGRGWFERLVDTLETTRGGTRLLFRASVDFP